MNDRTREHGVIDAQSVRVVGMNPAEAQEVILDREDFRYPLTADCLDHPLVKLAIADQPHATLVNGLGVNWPPDFQGEAAFPEEGDETGWQTIFDAMTDAGIAWVRYWLELDELMVDGQVAASHRFLGRLDRLQAWAAESGATLMLDFCMIPPAWRFDDVRDAPADCDRYVHELLIPVLRHIVEERHVDRIRQLCLYNEPFNADVSPYLFYAGKEHDSLAYYVQLHATLRQAMDAVGLTDISLIGPNSANLFQRHLELLERKGLTQSVKDAFGELDVHMWRCRFDYYPPSKRWPGYPMSEGVERYLKPTLKAAARLGKSLSLTEVGSMYFNELPTSTRVTRHDAVLTMVEQLVRAIDAGVAGAMIWSFLSAGKTDGQWGWLEPRQGGFAKVPHLFHGFATLMRYHRAGAAIHRCEIALADFSPYVSAAAIELPGGGHTIWLINDHPVERIRVRLERPTAWQGCTLAVHRKGFDPEPVQLPLLTGDGPIELVLIGMSLTTLTTLPG